VSYQPDPIDVSQVSLSPEQLQLTERLAENTHDLWASQRIAEGWTYGARRDDAQKHHPCLVPYDQLPESEKEYDRISALGTLKVILKLGYRILPPQKP
jgi:hypothetical protein